MKRNIFLVAVLFSFSAITFAQESDNRREKKERPSLDQIFEELDADGDALISSEEAKGPLQRDFSKIDTNEDGFLSREEIENAPKPERGRGRDRGQRD